MQSKYGQYMRDPRDALYDQLRQILDANRESLQQYANAVPCAVRTTDQAVVLIHSLCCNERNEASHAASQRSDGSPDALVTEIGKYYGVPPYTIREFVYDYVARNIRIPVGTSESRFSDLYKEYQGESLEHGEGEAEAEAEAEAAAAQEARDMTVHERQYPELRGLTLAHYAHWVRHVWCPQRANVAKIRDAMTWYARHKTLRESMNVASMLADVARMMVADNDALFKTRMRELPTAKQAVDIIAHTFNTTPNLVLQTIFTECVERM